MAVGGGGAGGSSDGGGGGGYSGGGAPGNGNGSGSCVDGSLTDLVGAENSGNGPIYITESESIELPGSAVPEPASLTLLGAARIGIGAMHRGKRNTG